MNVKKKSIHTCTHTEPEVKHEKRLSLNVNMGGRITRTQWFGGARRLAAVKQNRYMY